MQQKFSVCVSPTRKKSINTYRFWEQASLNGRSTTLEEKRSFRPQFEPKKKKLFFFFQISALLDVRHYPKLQPYVISRETNDATLRK